MAPRKPVNKGGKPKPAQALPKNRVGKTVAKKTAPKKAITEKKANTEKKAITEKKEELKEKWTCVDCNIVMDIGSKPSHLSRHHKEKSTYAAKQAHGAPVPCREPGCPAARTNFHSFDKHVRDHHKQSYRGSKELWEYFQAAQEAAAGADAEDEDEDDGDGDGDGDDSGDYVDDGADEDEEDD